MSRWATPLYSKKQVNRAGEQLARPFDVVGNFDVGTYIAALDTINNFRSIHGHPLSTFQTTLRIKGRLVDPDILVAQRIKRMSSIEMKLQRFPTMTLSQMQDIGGCRAVVSDASTVNDLVDSYLTSDLKHKLHTNDDYIISPKDTGYRGRHLIYRYYSDKIATYNDLKIEMQFRSQFQHAWATAVEIVGTFTRQALKSSQGEENWWTVNTGPQIAAEISDLAADARREVARLHTVLPRDCAGVVMDVCGLLKGLQEVERDRGWPRRSAKLVLRIGLEQLAQHYGLEPFAMGQTNHRRRTWMDEGARPERFE